ncbi:MAG: proline dehydrogenase family protein [Gemmatimonadetes bacterium]|nr:proline dehydrogenase family protein [Gemmatimonadota bacterium]
MLIWPASRFVAGERMPEALAAVRRLNERGILASLDLLGENVSERAAAEAASCQYVHLLRGIADAGVNANISIKLTMLGLDIEPELAREHLLTILDAARETDNWVRIDMEGSPYTELTLEAFYDVFETKKNVGVVIQSMLRRSASDIERLVGAGARVRLVKGAYREPAPLAYQEKRVVNEQFDRLAERLLEAGNAPAIATHDDARIAHTIAFTGERGIAPERFEFQMLYGIREATQVALAERGYRMRVYVPYGEEWFPYFYRRLRERKENVSFVLRNLLKR